MLIYSVPHCCRRVVRHIAIHLLWNLHCTGNATTSAKRLSGRCSHNVQFQHTLGSTSVLVLRIVRKNATRPTIATISDPNFLILLRINNDGLKGVCIVFRLRARRFRPWLMRQQINRESSQQT
ncbi:hypothetical protein D3C81_394880 [compost metagenome]